MVSGRSLRYAAGVLLIAVGYYTFAKGGLALLLTGPAGAFWPATGLGIAVLYLGGLRWWPGVLLGDLLTREFALPLWAVLVETAGNMARALVAVLILQRLVGRRAAMDRLEQVGAVLAAVAVGEAVSATVAMLVRQNGGLIEVPEMSLVLAELVAGRPGGRAGRGPARPGLGARPPRRCGGAAARSRAGLMLAAVAGLSVIAVLGWPAAHLHRVPGVHLGRTAPRPPGSDPGGRGRGGDRRARHLERVRGPFVERTPTDSALNLQLYIILRSADDLLSGGDRQRTPPYDAGAGRVAAPRG